MNMIYRYIARVVPDDEFKASLEDFLRRLEKQVDTRAHSLSVGTLCEAQG